MPVVKKKNSSGTWDTITTSLKTNVTSSTVSTFPTTITAGDWPLIGCGGAFKNKSTTMASTGMSVTIPATGTYRIKWTMEACGDDSGDTETCALYKNGTQVGSNYTWTADSSCTPGNFSADISCSKNDVIEIYMISSKKDDWYCAQVENLMACIDWDPHIS